MHKYKNEVNILLIHQSRQFKHINKEKDLQLETTAPSATLLHNKDKEI